MLVAEVRKKLSVAELKKMESNFTVECTVWDEEKNNKQFSQSFTVFCMRSEFDLI